MRLENKLPTPEGIGPGQVATLRVPLGPTYHRFNIRMQVAVGGNDIDVAAGSWKNYIDDIRLIVDGQTRIEMSADYLVSRNQYWGVPMVAGILPLLLSNPKMRTIGGEDLTSYGTAAGMTSFTLEIDLKPGITINFLRVYAVTSEPEEFGAHLHIQRYNRSFGNVGVDEVSDAPARDAHALLGVHVDSGDIGDVEIVANNSKIRESDASLRNAGLQLVGRTPQAGYTHVDFLTENRIGNALAMMLNDFRMKFDHTVAPGTYSIYAETLRGA